jgi:hypothetical protein
MNKLHFEFVLVMLAFSAVGCSSAQSQAATPNIMPSPSRTRMQMAETVSAGQESEYTLIDGQCNNENCLFVTEAESDFLIGVAAVSGYYVQLERSAFEQTKRCDSFIITAGSSALIESLLSLIEHGNTVYIKNDLGQPIISLDLNTLPEAEKQQLISSSAFNPVSVVLLATPPRPQGAPVCFSHFEILRVK